MKHGKKRGPKPKPAGEKQAYRVSVNMTRAEFAQLKRDAKAKGVSLAAVFLDAWRRTR